MRRETERVLCSVLVQEREQSERERESYTVHKRERERNKPSVVVTCGLLTAMLKYEFYQTEFVFACIWTFLCRISHLKIIYQDLIH